MAIHNVWKNGFWNARKTNASIVKEKHMKLLQKMKLLKSHKLLLKMKLLKFNKLLLKIFFKILEETTIT